MITIDFETPPLLAEGTVLDIGCGSGRHTAAAYDLDQGMIVGADTNLNDIKSARTKLKWHEKFRCSDRSRWALTVADITDLPFDDHTMDLVICSEVLEHIPDHNKAIKECIRVLKPNRHFVVSVPRRWPETICWALSHQYRTTQGGHIRIYRTNQLVDRIQSTGMVHWRTHHAHSLHVPFWWLKCLLGPQRHKSSPVALYHRFLSWDLMEKPRLTRLLEALLNPVMGKSVVLYFLKPQ